MKPKLSLVQRRDRWMIGVVAACFGILLLRFAWVQTIAPDPRAVAQRHETRIAHSEPRSFEASLVDKIRVKWRRLKAKARSLLD